MIEVIDLTKTYGKKNNLFTALDDVNFSIPIGASVAITGKSGSGKSTLMHIMSGLDKPNRGEVRINGRNIFDLNQKAMDRFRSRTMGFIFQSYFVQANESSYDNVSLPIEIASVPYNKRKKMIEDALNSVELSDKKKSKAKELSGGQKQRLAVARAIVNSPKILFADEPTGNLDSVTGQVIEDLLFDYNKKHKATLIIVTHDHDLANRCDIQVHIKDGKITSVQGTKR
ncbi:MAG: ABC transporter ATP-binding protein [Candidatus Saccharimonadaceae bacterium]|nr:ABC transporter ATP-binding protein [Candidatus Saccharimonadaceae bacterium]